MLVCRNDYNHSASTKLYTMLETSFAVSHAIKH